MTRDAAPGRGLAPRLVAIAAGALVLLAAVVGLARLLPEPSRPQALDAPIAEPVQASHAAEADVFQTAPSQVASPPWLPRRGTAHPRTLATIRALRAYPGAPPRIPHGLTREEFLEARCLTCHERGGYSQRFGAYAPVTPHPDFEACLQCHPPNDAVVGIPLPGAGRDATCRQCHAPGITPGAAVTNRWVAAAWPTLDTAAFVPPTMPHGLQLRGNCLACHMGPGAPAEIRTPHPERSNCRQCHVQRGHATAAWVRAVDTAPPATEGAR